MVSMLPVSGAEQLKTSGAERDAAHDFAQRRVIEVGQAFGRALRLRQEQVPQPGCACFGLELFDDGGRNPAVAFFRAVAVDFSL